MNGNEDSRFIVERDFLTRELWTAEDIQTLVVWRSSRRTSIPLKTLRY
jgi:hypothetical protein